ncbi:MAG: diguanylate cyclase [Sphingobium sp.]|nr:diguanylate cyclase [Sphingobium sp.]
MIGEIVRTARRSLLAAFGLTALLLILLPIERNHSDQAIAAATEKARAASVISEQIRLEDERLTMSAWMAAATGEQRWIERYERHLPAIDRDIAQAKALAPSALSRRFDAETSKANAALVRMETASFEAVRKGDMPRARSILDSNEYRAQKKILSDGTTRFVHGLTAHAAKDLANVKGRKRVLLFMLSLLAGASFLGMWHLLNTRLSRLEVDYSHAERRLHMRAAHDELTGLLNRRSFNDRATEMIERANASGVGLTVITMLDLDNFKDVNDTLGHQVGDELIRAVGRRIMNRLPESAILARLGGDEFAIAANALDEAHAQRIIEEALGCLKETFALHSENLRISTSAGIAIGPIHADNVDDLLRLADMALYRSKSDGRNSIQMFSPEMDESVRIRRELESDLRNAIADGQLELHYQPLCNAPGSDMSGVEALVRWNHPTKGLISPALFVPIAERNGQICELGAWVLERAFQDARRWPTIITAINLSPRQLKHPDFLSTLKRLVERLEVDPRRFELEVTESLLLEESERVQNVLATPAPHGVPHRARRFRHRLFVAQLSAQIRLRQDQDRPELHQEHRNIGGSGRDHPFGRQSWPRAAYDYHGRGRGNAGTTSLPRSGGVPSNAGLSVRQARYRGRNRGSSGAATSCRRVSMTEGRAREAPRPPIVS